MADALVDELRAELRRERDRADRLDADARAWQARYLALADRALLADLRPDRPATAAPPPADAARPPRDRDPESAVVSAARAILGDQLPNILFGRRR